MENREYDVAREEQEALLSYYKGEKEPETKDAEAEAGTETKDAAAGATDGGSADRLPAAIAAPVGRTPWSSGLLECLSCNDEYLGSDMEVCCLGLFCPCVLYGSNVDRLHPSQGLFLHHCMFYTSLYVFGNSLFGGNYLAPCVSYPSRSALRRKFNLEGHGENIMKNIGCGTNTLESEEARESCDVCCDLAVHFWCHTCALCQEGRELRRRVPHPGFDASFVPMRAPMQQSMSPQ